MERESNPMQAQCRSGCGFYGSTATDGLCSLCYKEALKKKQQPPTTAPSGASTVSGTAFNNANTSVTAFGNSSSSNNSNAVVAIPSSFIDTAVPTIPIISPTTNEKVVDKETEGAECSTAISVVGDDDEQKDADKDSKKKKNRCAVCRKKLGLTGFECRCGGLFCAVHRYSDKHDCQFDYRLLGATEIRRNNPVVVGEKIKKI
ncbi:UNVERIFIED_CONTAM: hypothetical protein PYX00_008788 [Menopon gallinae]|uniref:Zinc finger A20 and AN1 domain-containing stress-associated protein 6 n=1 Tax=Menopon gallinae TaxID=328185 RepID=A0AAW2HQX8_9NEOP